MTRLAAALINAACWPINAALDFIRLVDDALVDCGDSDEGDLA